MHHALGESAGGHLVWLFSFFALLLFHGLARCTVLFLKQKITGEKFSLSAGL